MRAALWVDLSAFQGMQWQYNGLLQLTHTFDSLRAECLYMQATNLPAFQGMLWQSNGLLLLARLFPTTMLDPIVECGLESFQVIWTVLSQIVSE